MSEQTGSTSPAISITPRAAGILNVSEADVTDMDLQQIATLLVYAMKTLDIRLVSEAASGQATLITIRTHDE